MLAGVLLYACLSIVNGVGSWAGIWAARLDCKLDDWRHRLRTRPDVVSDVVGRIAHHVQQGATAGAEHYGYLDDDDMRILARAIDNLGCYCTVAPRHVQWSRRDTRCKGRGRLLGPHAFAPADRDALAEAIGNLDGEG